MLHLGKSLFVLTFILSTLLFYAPSAFAHAGHDHSEESPTISTTQKQASPEAKVLQTNTKSEEEQQHATPLWIPIAAVVGGIVVGVVGIALLHTRVLHPKNK